MSEKTARKWRSGRLPSERDREREYRTRPDGFAAAWEWVESELARAPGLEALTIFEELQSRHPGQFQEGQLRTLQRRVRQWRAEKGAPKEVMFAQTIEPGRQAQSDFTNMNERGITIGGEPFPHLLYHFQLPYSNWEYAEIAVSETFEALSQGFQNAAWKLGGLPGEHRTDNLSAATYKISDEAARALTERYAELMTHYGVKATRNTPGRGHENGDVEQSHFQLDHRAIEQALLVRGSRDFETREAYTRFFEQIIDRRNRGRTERLAEERPHFRSLPSGRLDAWKEKIVRVGPGSTIRVDHNTYSVPSRLIGREVSARIYAELLELRAGGTVVAKIERLRGQERHRIDYRHVIDSLVRKPGAFRGYRYREDLYPSVVFRKAYDALVARFSERGDQEYVRVLHLAAKTSERDVAAALELLLEAGQVPEIGAVRELASDRPMACPVVRVRAPELSSYDSLIEMAVPA